MKKLYILSIIFLVICKGVFSQEILQKEFEDAANSYEKENYEDALTKYKILFDKVPHVADIAYNIANCNYKLNNIAASIYFYEKALKLDPKHTEASNNLVYANRMKIDAIEVLPETFFQKVANRTYRKWSYNTWAYILVSFSVLVAIFFLLYYLSYHSTKKILYFNLFVFSGILFLGSLVFTYKTKTEFDAIVPEAIVYSSSVEIHNAAASNADIAFVLHEGTKVQIIDTIEDWIKIRTANGRTGWTMKRVVKVL